MFLIPLATSSLRGLTHVLSCAEETGQSLTLVNQEDESPVLLGSTRIKQGAPELLCGGLSLNIEARDAGPGRVMLVVPITNHSELTWRGSVKLELNEATIPLDIGRIGPGKTVEDRVTVRLSERAQEASGTLLIGP